MKYAGKKELVPIRILFVNGREILSEFPEMFLEIYIDGGFWKLISKQYV